MKIIEANEVYEKLTMDKCINLMREVFKAFDQGKAYQPMRTIHGLPGGNLYAFMPAYLGDDDYFGAKVLTAFPKNNGTEYPSHLGYVHMCESVHGSTIGFVDAMSITTIRTGAVSAVATDLLARQDAKRLAIIGCGAQGRGHLEAMLCVRKSIEEVNCYDINEEYAKAYAKEQSEKYGIKVTAKSTVEEAVKNADIICTVTPSKEAYLKAEWVKSGCHVNAVGTFSPTTREITSELVAKSRLYADSVESMKAESGEYLIPLQEGLIEESDIAGSVGGLLNGKDIGRISDEDITIFDALGLAIEDVMAAKYMITLED